MITYRNLDEMLLELETQVDKLLMEFEMAMQANRAQQEMPLPEEIQTEEVENAY